MGSVHIRDPDRGGRSREVQDLNEGVTFHEEVDEVTGQPRTMVMDSPDEKNNLEWSSSPAGKR